MKSFVDRIHEAAERHRAAEKAEHAEETLAARWAAGDPNAIKRVDELVAGSSIDYLQAQTVAGVLDKVEGFNRLMLGAQWQRDGLLREIERRRHLRFAQRAREELHKLDAEDVTVDAVAQPAKKDAA